MWQSLCWGGGADVFEGSGVSSWAPVRRATMASCIASVLPCCISKGESRELSLVLRETMASCIAFVCYPKIYFKGVKRKSLLSVGKRWHPIRLCVFLKFCFNSSILEEGVESFHVGLSSVGQRWHPIQHHYGVIPDSE